MKHVLLTAFLSASFIINCTAQNIGIGTTAPAEKLHINGNVKSDTIKVNGIKLPPDAGEGKILTSDASGNASWQEGSRLNGNTGFGVWGDCATNANIGEFQPVADSAGLDDLVGQAVAISGNFAALGCPSDDVNGNAGQGSINLYEFNGSKWIFKQKLLDPSGAAYDGFGGAIAMSGNFLVTGSRNDDIGANGSQGSACVFRYNGTTWVYQQKLTDAAGASGDVFGYSVAIYSNFIIVGSPSDDVGTNVNQGSACIFRFNGTSWVLMQKITDLVGDAADNFGSSVAISATHALVGSPAETGTAGVDDRKGCVSVFYYNGSTWPMVQRLSPDDALGGDYFGSALSVSGNDLLIGAMAKDYGTNTTQGAVYFFNYGGSSWQQVEKFVDVTGITNDQMGTVVSISGNYAMAAGGLADVGSSINQGKVILFQKIGNYWRKLQQITDPSGIAIDIFGSDVGLDGTTKRFVIGAQRVYRSGGGFFGKVN
ncbi:MAG: FG-GAP repeat protein [Ferruginibacter sp.]